MSAPNYKICLIGQSHVGKTCLIKKLIDSGFDSTHVTPTVEIEYSDHKLHVDGKDVQLRLADRPGEQDHAEHTQSFFKGCHGILAVYDVSDNNSLEKLGELLSDALSECKDPESLIVGIVGNKADLQNNCDAGLLESIADENEAFTDTTSAL